MGYHEGISHMTQRIDVGIVGNQPPPAFPDVLYDAANRA